MADNDRMYWDHISWLQQTIDALSLEGEDKILDWCGQRSLKDVPFCNFIQERFGKSALSEMYAFVQAPWEKEHVSGKALDHDDFARIADVLKRVDWEHRDVCERDPDLEVVSWTSILRMDMLNLLVDAKRSPTKGLSFKALDALLNVADFEDHMNAEQRDDHLLAEVDRQRTYVSLLHEGSER